MLGNSHENFHPVDVRPPEFEISRQNNTFETPTMNDLKSKLEHIFDSQEVLGNHIKSSIDNPLNTYDIKTVTFDDGTVIHLLEKPNGEKKSENTELQQGNSSDVSQSDIKPTRELTEDEKIILQEKLGWTDKQISKCTIDEDGVTHYKTDREDMAGKTGENGVPYERKTVDIHGIKVQGVFPVFNSACDVQLPEELEKASNARQFKECNRQLKENVAKDPALRDSFTPEQLEDIENGDTPSGYVWHHNEEPGKMQLVKVEDHDRTQGGAAHSGGKTLWGGSYSNHEITDSDATQDSALNEEVK